MKGVFWSEIENTCVKDRFLYMKDNFYRPRQKKDQFIPLKTK